MNDRQDGMALVQMSTEASAQLLERVVVGGDLSKLSAQERMQYYASVCESVGLNPLTKPFEYIYLDGKMTLYARKDATDQLRDRHGVNVTKLERDHVKDPEEGDYYAVTAYGTNAKGRSDSSMGVVHLSGAHGQKRADMMMKAETKAKRRLTLSLCGLGMLDESEVEIPAGAVRATEVVDVPRHPLANALAPHQPPAEVTTLFPFPEADRAGLIQRAKIATARCNKQEVAEKKIELLGSATAKYEDVDLAALVSYVQWAEKPL